MFMSSGTMRIVLLTVMCGRTENPWEANYFYIPLFSYDFTYNLGDPRPHLAAVLDYVQQAWPFWNITKGRHHAYWLGQDRGG
jgi:hypothetical protein